MMGIPFFPALSAFLLLIILVKYWTIKCKASTLKLPPGPPKLAFIGNLHQLTGTLSHHTLANLAKQHGPIMHLQLGEQPAVVISSSEIAKEVLKTKEVNFAQRPELLAMEIMSFTDSGFVFAPYGEHWRQLRKICVVDLFSAKRVKSYRNIREEEVWHLVEKISDNQGVVMNLSPVIFSLTNTVTSRAMFGLKCTDEIQGEFMSVVGQLSANSAVLHLADLYPSIKFLRCITGLQPRLEKIEKKMSEILDGIIHKRRRESCISRCRDDDGENILDVLIQLQESNDHDRDNVGLQLSDKHLKAITTLCLR